MTALYDFYTIVEGELSFRLGETLIITDQSVGDGWLKGKNSAGNSGLVPASYFQKMNEAEPVAPPRHSKLTSPRHISSSSSSSTSSSTTTSVSPLQQSRHQSSQQGNTSPHTSHSSAAPGRSEVHITHTVLIHSDINGHVDTESSPPCSPHHAALPSSIRQPACLPQTSSPRQPPPSTNSSQPSSPRRQTGQLPPKPLNLPPKPTGIQVFQKASPSASKPSTEANSSPNRPIPSSIKPSPPAIKSAPSIPSTIADNTCAQYNDTYRNISPPCDIEPPASCHNLPPPLPPKLSKSKQTTDSSRISTMSKPQVPACVPPSQATMVPTLLLCRTTTVKSEQDGTRTSSDLFDNNSTRPSTDCSLIKPSGTLPPTLPWKPPNLLSSLMSNINNSVDHVPPLSSTVVVVTTTTSSDVVVNRPVPISPFKPAGLAEWLQEQERRQAKLEEEVEAESDQEWEDYLNDEEDEDNDYDEDYDDEENGGRFSGVINNLKQFGQKLFSEKRATTIETVVQCSDNNIMSNDEDDFDSESPTSSESAGGAAGGGGGVVGGTGGRQFTRLAHFTKGGGDAYLFDMQLAPLSDTVPIIAIHNLSSGPTWAVMFESYSCTVECPRKQSKFRGMKSFIVYQITPSFSSVKVSRRYKHFDWLQQRLVEKYSTVAIPPLPEKQIAGRFDAQFVSGRLRRLQLWMNRMCRHPVIAQSDVFLHFLTCSDLKKWKAGKRKAEKDKYQGGLFFQTLQAPSDSFDTRLTELQLDSFGRFVKNFEDSVRHLLNVGDGSIKRYQGSLKNEFMKLGSSIGALSKSFELDDRPESCRLTSAVSSTGRAFDDVSKLFEQQPTNDIIPLMDGLYEYKGLLSTLPDILLVHRASTNKIQENAGKYSETEIETIQSRADVITYSVLAEMDNFQEARVVDFKVYMQQYLSAQINFYKEITSRLQQAYVLFEQ